MRIETEAKDNILRILENDSILLKKHELIDYSVFLVEVERKKLIKESSKKTMGSLIYDMMEKQYLIKEIENLDETAVKAYLRTKTIASEKSSPSKAMMKFKKGVYKAIEEN